jgi:hypothetical protein
MNEKLLWLTPNVWGEPCEDEKYPLTCGNVSCRVILVPDSARQPEPEEGRQGNLEANRVHEVEAGAVGKVILMHVEDLRVGGG